MEWQGKVSFYNGAWWDVRGRSGCPPGPDTAPVTPSIPLEQFQLVGIVGDLEIVKLLWGNFLIWFSAGKPRRIQWPFSRFTIVGYTYNRYTAAS